MNTEINNIKTIQNQEKIRILFIILNLLALYADTEVEKSLKNEKNEKNGNTDLSNKIYLGITFVNVFVLIYYIVINNKALNNAKKDNKSTNIFEVKNVAFVVSLIAVILFIYVQLISTTQNNKNTELY